MAEAFLEIGKCKIGMNQSVGVIYDDQTGRILSIQARGRGRGLLVTNIWLPGNQRFTGQRLAHKPNSPILDLLNRNLFIDLTTHALPGDLVIQVTWQP